MTLNEVPPLDSAVGDASLVPAREIIVMLEFGNAEMELVRPSPVVDEPLK